MELSRTDRLCLMAAICFNTTDTWPEAVTDAIALEREVESREPQTEAASDKSHYKMGWDDALDEVIDVCDSEEIKWQETPKYAVRQVLKRLESLKSHPKEQSNG